MAIKASRLLIPTLRHTLRMCNQEIVCKWPHQRVSYLAKHVSGFATSCGRLGAEAPAVLVRDATRDEMPIICRMIHVGKRHNLYHTTQIPLATPIKIYLYI